MRLRAGDWVEVRSKEEILRSLDSNGRLDNMPFMPLTNFNNTVVLGSVVAWLVLFVPIWLVATRAVVAYRATLGEKVRQTRVYQAVTASKAYNVYTWFRG